MLPSISDAISVKGRTNKAIAADCSRHSQSVTAWFAGRVYIPPRMRNSLCAAIGADIDWQAYEVEFAEVQADRSARRAAPSPEPQPEPAPAPTAPRHDPAMPRPPTQRAVGAQSRVNARQTAVKPNAAHKTPPSASTAKGGIFGFLFDPSDDGMKFA